MGYYLGKKRTLIQNSFSDDLDYILSNKEMIDDIKNIDKAHILYKELSKKSHPDLNESGAEIQIKLNKYKKSYTILKKIEKEYFE
tara:strand:+ start:471 stop:725 length:255 start_codon:yes stop_codon:yes gene_type:complete